MLMYPTNHSSTGQIPTDDYPSQPDDHNPIQMITIYHQQHTTHTNDALQRCQRQPQIPH